MFILVDIIPNPPPRIEGFYKVRRVDEGFYVTCVAEESRLDVVTIGLREKDSPPMGFRAGCAFFSRTWRKNTAREEFGFFYG